MNHPLLRLLTGTFALVVSGCNSDQANSLTVVEGTVRNPYLGQPVPAVSIAVYRVFSTWSGSYSDSLTATQTDAAGHYRLSFDATRSAAYEVSIARPLNLYTIDRGLDSHPEAVPGTTTQIDFSVTPSKTVMLDVQTSKGGKTTISFGFQASDNGYWFGGSIFSDTIQANQNITFSQPVQVIPNRKYRFTKITANRYRVPGKNYDDFKDYTYTTLERTVGYNDTTLVKFR